MAPAVLLHEPEARKSADVWAVGCIIKEIFSEKGVWPLNSMFDAKDSVVALMEREEILDLSHIPPRFLDIVRSCFDYDPENRVGIRLVMHAFSNEQKKN